MASTPEPELSPDRQQQTPPAKNNSSSNSSNKAMVSPPEVARFYSPYDIVKRARSLTPMGHDASPRRSEPIRRRLRQHETFDDAVQLLKAAQQVMILAGAGISTSIGIPDFRSKDGLYNNVNSKKRFADPQELFTKSAFCDDPLAFYSDVMPVIPRLRTMEDGGGAGGRPARPEDIVDYIPRFGHTHAFFKLLDDKNKLRTIYTQNIDGLEKAAGVDPSRVINCHGSWDTATCMTCGGKVSADDYLPVVYKGALPLCECAKVDERPVISLERKRRIRAARPQKTDVPVEYLKVQTSSSSSTPKLRKSESSPSLLKKRRRGSDDDDETSDPLSRPGLLKPDITFFDEGISRTYGPRLLRDADQVDLFLIIGTSLPVEPVNKLPFEIPPSVPQIWISREHCRRPGLRVDIELLGDCDLVVDELCRRAGWSGALENRVWRNRFGSNLQSRRQLSELHRRRSQAAGSTGSATGTGPMDTKIETSASIERKMETSASTQPKTETSTSTEKRTATGTAPPSDVKSPSSVQKFQVKDEHRASGSGRAVGTNENGNINGNGKTKDSTNGDSGLALRPASVPQMPLPQVQKPQKQVQTQTQVVQKPLPPTKVKIEADLGTDWKWYIRPR